MSQGPWNPANQGPQGGGTPYGGPPQGFPPGNQPGYPPGYPPQGGRPPQGPPPGYPPQGVPAQGLPPYGQQPPYGQPSFAPPGQPAYGQQPGHARPGGLPPHPGAPTAPPAKGRNPVPFIIAGVVVLALLIGGIAFAVINSNRSTVAVSTPTAARTSAATTKPVSASAVPSPSVATTRPTTATTAATTAKPTTPAGKAPIMPTEVGGLKALGTPNENIAMYMSADAKTSAMAMAIPVATVKDATAQMKDVKVSGPWSCGQDKDLNGLACVSASPYGGVVLIGGQNDDMAKLTAWGNEFLTKWK